MTLINRISRLFRADMHAVLDSLEEPAALLKQAVREMDDVLAAEERQVRLLQQQQVELAGAATECAALEQRLEQELSLCFDAGKDDLARTLVRRRLETEQRQTLLARRAQALRGAETEAQARVAAHRQRLAELRQLAALSDTALARDSDDQFGHCHEVSMEGPISDAAVEVAFLREKQRRSTS